ncbi:uncharacterized protein [Aristolochia californica]|uniref:uncharacterized protein n=1 Tax=Aristolochia californica TaxID=171875 RepID=UPI0035DC713D
MASSSRKADHPQPLPPPPPPPLRQKPPPRGCVNPAPPTVPRYTKLDFPMYDGSFDPLIWLHKYDNFFSNQGTLPEGKVQLAAFHMLDEALLWFHQFKNEFVVYDWEFFKENYMLRFGPPLCSNPVDDLVNLKQLGTTEQYQKFFQEKLV